MVTVHAAVIAYTHVVLHELVKGEWECKHDLRPPL